MADNTPDLAHPAHNPFDGPKTKGNGLLIAIALSLVTMSVLISPQLRPTPRGSRMPLTHPHPYAARRSTT